MPSERELDQKLLDDSLERFHRGRGTFARDLKIAALLVLGFQFVIFFRSIDLNQKQANLDKNIRSLKDDQKAFTAVQARLIELQDELQKGKVKLSERLQDLTPTMRAEIVSLEGGLGDLRKASQSESPVSSGSMAVQTFQGQRHRDNPLIANLTAKDKKVLAEANPGDPELQRIIKRTVEQGIVRPLFWRLNADKDQLLTKPVTDKMKLLSATIQNDAKTLEKHSANPGDMLTALNQAQEQLQALRFTPPKSERWWRTVRGKVQTSKELEIDEKQAVDGVAAQLDRQERDVGKISSRLSDLLEESQESKEALAKEMQDLQDRYNVVQGHLEIYAKPLSVIAVEPRQAVLYYPLILSALFVFFVWRYLALRRRGRVLAARYREFNVSDDVIQVAFGGFPQVRRDGGHTGPATWLVCATALLPGILLAVSLQHIWGSGSLRQDAPVGLYVTASVFYVLAYVALVADSFGPKSKFLQQLLRSAGGAPMDGGGQPS